MSTLDPVRRRFVPAAAVLVAALVASAAETTHLEDASGVLTLDAPGSWRVLKGDYAFSASGFIAGVKRTELYGRLYADAKDEAAAAKKWRDARTAESPSIEFTNPGGDATRWIAVESAKRSVEYGRALAGAGKAAVVWAKLNGEPGSVDADVFAVLDAAKLDKPGAGAAAPAATGGADKTAGDTRTAKDREFAIELTVPKTMVDRKEDPPLSDRVVLSLKGPVGADPDACLDVYALPDFDRTDAAGWWWIESERRRWKKLGIKAQGEPPSFLLLPGGQTWTRHVRVLPTKAGMYAIKLDIESSADKAGDAFLDTLVEGKGLAVLKPRPDRPPVPPGATPIENDAWLVFNEADPAEGDALAKDALATDAAVGKALGLDAFEGRKGAIHVLKDQGALDAALRPLGGPPGRAAWWSVKTREVLCRAGIVGAEKSHAEFVYECAREATRRRFGYRPPFWVEHGIGHFVETGAYTKGRLDQTNPSLSESAHNCVSSGLEFEVIRWWTEEDSGGNPEHEAVVWGLWLVFNEEGTVAQKWADLVKTYVQALRRIGKPADATKLWPYERDGELIDEFKKRMKKLEH